MTLTLRYEQYTNGNLYIGIDNGDELYADLTVNLDIPLPPNQAYVDVNNFPEAEAFIRERNLGEPIDIYGRSCCCKDPLYVFKLPE